MINDIRKPKNGEKIYFVNTFGIVDECVFEEDDEMLERLVNCGNFYFSYKDAEQKAREEKYSRLFAKYIEEFGGVCDWSNSNQPKCFCYWDLSTDDFRTTFGGTMKLPLDYATNKKVLEDAMSFIDVDNFKKYVAKVKDSHLLMNDKLLDDFGDGDDLPHIEEEKKKPINIDNDDEDDEFDESLLDYDFEDDDE